MGTSVNATLPGVVLRPSRRARPQKVPRFIPEPRERRTGRLLVTLFLRDQTGLLEAVLKVLDSTERAGSASGRPKAASPATRSEFSVDGSFVASVGGCFVMALIVHPCGPSYPGAHRHLRERLIAAVCEQSGESREVIEDGVRVEPFLGIDSTLFVNRVFTEYRFGAGPEGPSLTSVTAEFAAALGKHGVPIAYLYFPDDGDDAQDDTDWVRIGVGAPEAPIQSLEVDSAAVALARRNRCALYKYDPSAEAPSLSEKFIEIVDFRDPLPAPKHKNEVPDARDGADVVFVRGEARSGFVGQILENDISGRIVGGSMSVVGGVTMACWVLPSGTGSSFESRIRRSMESYGLAAPGRFDTRRVQVQRAPSPHSMRRGHLWLAWRLPDRPGVFRRIVGALRQAVREESGNADADVRYAVSRVLDFASGCAGKIKFDITSPLDVADDSLVRRLQDRVLALIEQGSPASGTAPIPVGDEDQLVIGRMEPGEEPWASLVVARQI